MHTWARAQAPGGPRPKCPGPIYATISPVEPAGLARLLRRSLRPTPGWGNYGIHGPGGLGPEPPSPLAPGPGARAPSPGPGPGAAGPGAGPEPRGPRAYVCVYFPVAPSRTVLPLAAASRRCLLWRHCRCLLWLAAAAFCHYLTGHKICRVRSLTRESHRRLLSQNGYGRTFIIIIISEGPESTIWAYTH